MNSDDDNEGQRVDRAKRKKLKTTPNPVNMLEAEQGAVLVLVVECSTWLGGKIDGLTDRLYYVIDPRTGKKSITLCNMPRAIDVAAIRIEDFDASRLKGE